MRDKLSKKIIQLSGALALSGVLLLVAPDVNAQQEGALPPPPQQQVPTITDSAQIAGNTATKEKTPAAVMPVFTNYKGITIGMSADVVREKLAQLKEKGEKQDFFVVSERESAQVFYDGKGLVRAISINYIGAESGAPDAIAVLGEELQPKANGTMHKLIRYPAAKYWVSYSRTAGDSPIITVTMKKIG